jgi:hypothetical protein
MLNRTALSVPGPNPISPLFKKNSFTTPAGNKKPANSPSKVPVSAPKSKTTTINPNERFERKQPPLNNPAFTPEWESSFAK